DGRATRPPWPPRSTQYAWSLANGSAQSRNAADTAAATALRFSLLHVLRSCGVVGKLKITPRGAVPLGNGEIVLIGRISQSAFSLQKAILCNALFEGGRQAAGQILLYDTCTLFRRGCGGGERSFANLRCLKIVRDTRELARDIRLQLPAGQFVYLARRARPENCASHFAIIDDPPRVRGLLANF